MYKIIEDEIANELILSIIRENADGSVSTIPVDEANSDYQQYLIDTDGGLSPE